MEARIFGRPTPREAPGTVSQYQVAQNPVLRGYALLAVAYIASSFRLAARWLWRNAGFARLRLLSDLGRYEPRWDPTVISIDPEREVTKSFQLPTMKAISRVTQPSRRHLSVENFHDAYLAHEVTPVQVVKALLKTVESNEDHKVAFISIKPNACLTAAARSAERYQSRQALGPLDGVPVAIKDEVDLAGYPRCCGSHAVASREAERSSWCVERLEKAGAIIVGKLNMHEYGLDTTNCNPSHGTPRNPHNPDFFTGGSSGGSAYVISVGLVPVAVGCDGGGSIRLPASYCGVVGLKPSHGRISVLPTSSIAPSVGVVGPMCNNLDDLISAYRTMAAPDPLNTASTLFPPASFQRYARDKVVAVITSQYDRATPSVRSLCNAAIKCFESQLGYTVLRDISFPYLQEGQLAHAMTILSEIHTQVKPVLGSDLSMLQPANKILLAAARETPAEDLLLAQKMRNLLMQHLSWLFSRYPDLIIVSPTSPIAGRKINRGDLAYGVSDANEQLRSIENVWLANFTGCPAISIPVGKIEGSAEENGLPVGLMGMSAWGKEDLLFKWAEDLLSHKGSGLKVGTEKPPTWIDLLALAKQETPEAEVTWPLKAKDD